MGVSSQFGQAMGSAMQAKIAENQQVINGIKENMTASFSEALNQQKPQTIQNVVRVELDGRVVSEQVSENQLMILNRGAAL